MADAIAFDTHRFVKNLTANGFTETQAEVLADEQVHLLNSNLATKTDCYALTAGMEKLRACVEQFKVELQAELRMFKADLLKWILGAMFAQTAVIAALIALL